MGEVVQKFILDLTGPISGLERTAALMQDLHSKVDSLQKTTKTAFSNVADVADNYNKSLGDGVKMYDKVAAAAKAAAKAQEDSLNGANAEVGDLKKSIQQLQIAMNSYKAIVDKSTDTKRIAEYNAKIVSVQKEIDRLGNIGRRGFDSLGNPIKAQLGLMEKLQRQADLYRKAIQQATLPENISKYNKRLEETESLLKKTAAVGRSGFDEFGNATQKSGGLMQSLKGNVLQFAGAVGIAFGVQQVLQFGKELFDLAKKAEGVELAFARIGSREQMQKLREQTKGTVSDLQLMQSAVKASNFKIPLDTLGSGLAFAQKRARETGESVDFLVDSIVNGIGRKSPLILDNLGLSVTEIQKEFQKTGDFATAVGNIIQREMEASGESVNYLADRTDRLSATWENIRLGAGKFMQWLFDPTALDTERVAEMTEELAKNYGKIKELSIAALDSHIDKLMDQKRELDAKRKQLVKDVEEGRISDAAGQVKDSPLMYQSKAIENVLSQLQNQSKTLKEQERAKANILTITELQAKAEAKITEAMNIIPETDKDKADRTRLLQEAEDIQKEIDLILGKGDKEAQKKRDEANKKREQAEQELNRMLLQLTEDAARARIEMLDKNSKQYLDAVRKHELDALAEMEKSMRQKQREAGLSSELSTDQLEQLRILSQQINKKYYDELYKQQQQQRDKILDLQKDSDAKELQQLENKYDAEIRAAEEAGQREVAIALRTAKEREKARLTRSLANKNIDYQEELSTQGALLDLNSLQGVDAVEIERLKQEKLLDLQIEFARKRLALIANETDDESTLRQLQLKNMLLELNKQKEDLENEQSKFSLQRLLGLDDEQYAAMTDAMNTTLNYVQEWTQNMVALRQREVESLTRQIDEKGRELDREIALAQEGFASNVQTKQAEYDQLKQQREQAMRDQQKAQRQQVLLDSALQISNMITSSSEIFKVMSPIPFVGVPLAIGLIATMFGAFFAAKSKAMQAASVKTYAKGGEGSLINGPSHAQGGIDVVENRTGRRIANIEGGENFYVTNKKSTDKYWPWLDAINANDERALSKLSLDWMLNGTGVITPNPETPQRLQQLQTEVKVVQVTGGQQKVENQIREMKQMTGYLKDLRDQGKGAFEVYETETHRVEKQGSRTRHIRKQ
ncbi:hypothetical protein [Pontibacter virosus]|uniref:Uncharacterized protein n=1 Tax=Pontibacter virosus TaxID=1765052 RepID=A0A2U1B3M9_9BACT|nr:hypothetical protein [Pontibacter virosus]PVY43258.1 hypothetical protein C8E01_102437 [Pontibacter virosus]